MRREFVVDTSVAVEWFVREDHFEAARDLADCGTRLVAPAMIEIEVANALSQKVRRGQLASTAVDEDLDALPRMLDEMVGHDDVLRPAMKLPHELDHTLYDCLYLEAALQREAVMVTADRRLLAKLGSTAYRHLAVALDSWTTALR